MKKYLLNFLFILIVISFFWYYFIFERIPRNIPYPSSVVTFIILSFMCLFQVYIIVRIIKPKPPHPLIMKFFERTAIIFLPLVLIEYSILRPRIQLLGCKLINYFYTLHPWKDEEIFYHKLYCFTEVYPRGFLALFLFVDTFFYHQINLFYLYLSLGLVPLICQYIIFCLKLKLGKNVGILDRKYYLFLMSTDDDTLAYFVQPSSIDINYHSEERDRGYDFKRYFTLLYTVILFNDCEPYDFRPGILNSYKNSVGNNISEEDLLKDFYALEPITFKLYCFLYNYEDIFLRYEQMFIKNTRLGIVGIYLLCWTYIFFSTFSSITIDIIGTLKDNIEPFSGIFL